MGQRDARSQQLRATAFVQGLTHVRTEVGGEKRAQLDLRDNGARESSRELHRVADMVVMAVREEDRIDAFRLELARRAGRIPGQEGIDVDPVAGGRVEPECGMAEPGESDHVPQRKRPWPGARSRSEGQ